MLFTPTNLITRPFAERFLSTEQAFWNACLTLCGLGANPDIAMS